MGNFKIRFYLTEGAYNCGIVAYEVNLGRTSRAAAVAYAKGSMRNSSYYCYEICEY